MAGLAYLRAVSFREETQLRDTPRRPNRVSSASLIDRMNTIPEDGFPKSPASPRKNQSGFKYSAIESTSLRRSSSSSSVSSLGSSRSFSITGVEYNENLRLLMDEITPADLSESDQRRAMIAINIVLSVMTVLTMVTQTVVTPLYMDAMSRIEVKSDAFIAGFLTCMWIPIIFFAFHFCFSWGRSFQKIIKPPDKLSYVFVAGTLAGLSNILVALTSLSLRTPTYLQGILQQTLVPFTAISRFIIIGKGIGKWQGCCLFVLFIGIFFTLEPSIFGMRPYIYPTMTHPVDINAGGWYFYVTFAFAWLPLAIGFVIMEKVQKAYIGKHKLAYIAWFQLFIFTSYILFMWIDFIPEFGLANTGDTNFLDKLSRGFACFYGGDDKCEDVPTLAVIYILAYSGTTVFSVLLIRYAEGAVFTVVVLALVTPIVTLFWMFFESLPEIHFAPKFDLATAFVLIGLVVMMPAVVMYAYLSSAFSGVETQDKNEETYNDNVKPKVTAPRLKPPPPVPRRKRTVSLNTVEPIPEQPERRRSKKRSSSTGKLPRVKSAPIISF